MKRDNFQKKSRKTSSNKFSGVTQEKRYSKSKFKSDLRQCSLGEDDDLYCERRRRK